MAIVGFISKSGYGFDFQKDHIWPWHADNIWDVVDQAKEYAGTLDHIRSSYDPESVYATTEVLDGINPDSHLMALADILAKVITEAEGIQLIAAQDFSDSDRVILAYPLEDGGYKPLSELREKLDPIFEKYLYMLTSSKSHTPGFINWNEEVQPKREFLVDTPLGKLKIYAKHEKDCPADYPGVYVDFVEPSGEQVMLACVEYVPSDIRIQTCVYGDGNSDSPTEIVHHENLNVDEYSRALRLINDFCEENFRHGLRDEDFQHPECIPVGMTTLPEDEIFTIQVYADLVNFALRTYIVLPTEDEAQVLIREDKYESLKDMNDNELECLDPSQLYNFYTSEWKQFACHPDALRCLRDKYPVGCKVHVTPPFNDNFVGTVKTITDDGRFIIDSGKHYHVALYFGEGDFYSVNEPVISTAYADPNLVADNRYPQDDRFSICVYQDPENLTLRTYIRLPDENATEVFIREDIYNSEAEFERAKIYALLDDWIEGTTESAWLDFSMNPAVKACMRSDKVYPLGSTVRFHMGETIFAKVVGVDAGLIFVKEADGTMHSLLFGWDEFYELADEVIFVEPEPASEADRAPSGICSWVAQLWQEFKKLFTRRAAK